MNIIEANREQIPAVTNLIRMAIVSLCSADHADLPRYIEDWLTERTEEKVSELVIVPGSKTWLAVIEDEIAGVSNITQQGKLELCYVHPDHISKGIGRCLLEQAELTARHNGVSEVRLISTTTAKRFYLAYGYQQYTDPIMQFGMPGYPMSKLLNYND